MTAPIAHGGGSAPQGPLTTALDTAYEVDVTPESAGWGHTSLRVVGLGAAGEQFDAATVGSGGYRCEDAHRIVLATTAGGIENITQLAEVGALG